MNTCVIRDDDNDENGDVMVEVIDNDNEVETKPKRKIHIKISN